MKLKLLASAIAATLVLSGCVVAVHGDRDRQQDRQVDYSYDREDQSRATSARSERTAKADDKVFATPYLTEELDNGLRIIIVKTDYPDVVAVSIPVSTGSRNEIEQGKTGFAHFFEHMMFKGTPDYPQEEYDKILKNAGVDNRASTSDDYTHYRTVFSKEHLETMLMLEADRFQNLQYSESQFKTEALTVKGEYLKNNASPVRKLLAASRDLAFTKHTYKHTTMGFFEDIEAMPDQLDYAKTFFDRFYKPEKVSIIVAGDVDPKQTLKWIKKYWGDWKRGDYVADIPKEPKQTQAKYKHLKFDGMPGHWVMQSYHGPSFNPRHKDKPAVDLMAELYFSSTSDIYQKLVVETQKASQLWTYFPDRKNPHLLYISAKVDKAEDLDFVRTEIAKTLAKARTELVDEDKLAKLKSNLKYSFANGLDSSSSIARTLAGYVHFNRDAQTVNRLYSMVDRITAQDIKKAANRYFIDANRTTISMSDLATLSQFENEVDIAGFVGDDKMVEPTFKIVDKTSDSAIIDVNWLFNTGAAADPKGKKGLAALTAAMIAQGGSQSRSYKDIQLAMYPLAGSFHSQLDKEMISFRGRVHKDNAQAWQKLVMDQLMNPGWREEDLKRVKTQLVNSIKSGLKTSNDEELGKEVLYSALYKGHPYESFNTGDISDIESITVEDISNFYQSQFTQAKLTLGLTGDMPRQAKQKLIAGLSKLPKGSETRLDIPPAPKLSGRHVTIVEKNAKSTAVSFGFPIDTIRSHKDWVALWLVRSYFGEHRSHNSYLYRRIRAIRGMNYGDYSYIEYYPRGMYQTKPDANLGRSSQIFQVWLRPLRSNSDAHFATRVAMFELEKLIKDGMSAENFEGTKNFLYNFVPQMVDSQDRQLGYALDSEFYQTEDFVSYVRNGLNKLTLDDVNRVIKENLQTDNIHYVFISGDGKDMKKRLVSDQTSSLEYNSEKPQELLDQDKIIQDYKLHLDGSRVNIKAIDDLYL
ncbi:MAG: insulinase family protein [Algicola sp.]|nr:insulinase family protein [Algicola sp.]